MTYAESVKKEGMRLGRQEGIQLGKQEGLQLGEQKAQLEKFEIAKKMLSNGMEQNLVAEITNLSLEQIMTLH